MCTIYESRKQKNLYVAGREKEMYQCNLRNVCFYIHENSANNMTLNHIFFVVLEINEIVATFLT
jgi:hypothetical protein